MTRADTSGAREPPRRPRPRERSVEERLGPGWSETWRPVDAHRVYCRVGPPADGVPLVHLHGFGISGAYLMPTARRLAHLGRTLVPDLPGYGRSSRSRPALGIPALAGCVLRLMDDQAMDQAVLVGNSMGCAISAEIAHVAPERVHRLVLVAPAGGLHNQPLPRALGQLAVDVGREGKRIARVAVPDYLRFGPVNALNLFAQLTRFPSLDRLLSAPVPTLAVLGDRDPLMPGPERVREVRALAPDHVTVVLIEGAAHAVNYTHPGELANITAAWLQDREIVDDPDEPGRPRRLTFDRRTPPGPTPGEG